MSLSVLIAILGGIVAVISGLNQLLQFGERLHNYYQGLKERKNIRELEKFEKAKTIVLAQKKPITLPTGLLTGSYRKATILPRKREFDVDISVYHPSGGTFKKNPSIA